MNAKFLSLVSILLVLVLVACGGGESAQENMPEPAPAATEAVVEVEKEVEVTAEAEEVAAASEEYYEEAESEEAPPPEGDYDEPVEPEPTPAGNEFQDYGVNPYIETANDQLSTFALDVDTASYTLARRYVMDGSLPPYEAVRVEEFVNYFEQGYEAPTESGFSIHADGALSPFHRDGTHLLRIGIQGYEVPSDTRKPASLTFVIDVSGSMDMENRLGLVKRSLQMLVDRLRPSDSVAIVVYGSQARMVLPPTSGEDRATILDAIYSLQPEGATNVEAGLKLGYQLANQAFLPNGINRVILCSDGVANVGATGPDQLLEEIRGYADAGITMTSLGFGMGNFNEAGTLPSDVLMEQLANDGNGMYAYIDSPDEAERLFVDELTSTLQTIALDGKIQVDFNPEIVARYRLIGYENRAIADEDFRNDSVDAGELGAGHSATALYAVQLTSNDASGRVATIQLRWEDPDSHEVTEIAQDLNTGDLGTTFENMSARYQLSVLVAQYAEVLRQSPWAEDVTLEQLAVRIERLAPQLDDEDVHEFAVLVGQASGIVN